MKNANLYKAISISIFLGLFITKWKWVFNFIGINFPESPSESIITHEYYFGLLAAIALGFSFPKHPTHCGIWLMFGPVLITHTIFIFMHGVPNMWPVELFLLALLTIPYVILSYVGSLIRLRLQSKPRSQV